jgi:hypothetical protein
MNIKPKIPAKLPLVETAIKSGKYLICPDNDPEYPDVHEPIHNPNRNDQVARWVPELFSYQMPDGGTFFCDILQNGDPMTPWGSSPSKESTEVDIDGKPEFLK